MDTEHGGLSALEAHAAILKVNEAFLECRRSLPWCMAEVGLEGRPVAYYDLRDLVPVINLVSLQYWGIGRIGLAIEFLAGNYSDSRLIRKPKPMPLKTLLAAGEWDSEVALKVERLDEALRSDPLTGSDIRMSPFHPSDSICSYKAGLRLVEGEHVPRLTLIVTQVGTRAGNADIQTIKAPVSPRPMPA